MAHSLQLRKGQERFFVRLLNNWLRILFYLLFLDSALRILPNVIDSYHALYPHFSACALLSLRHLQHCVGYLDSMDTALDVAEELVRRAGSSSDTSDSRPPVYKAIGISLAVASGVFIGVSFVLKKVGLLKANVKYSEEAGEGYGYLKNAWWWSGMTLMIIGEVWRRRSLLSI